MIIIKEYKKLKCEKLKILRMKITKIKNKENDIFTNPNACNNSLTFFIQLKRNISGY